jgi:hypothetical protein
VTKSLIAGALSAIAMAALATTPALAASPTGAAPSVPTGQTVTFNVPASPNGFTENWTFSYPGDNSNITVDAGVSGLDPSFLSAVGFNVFDVSHQTAPVEIATLQTNQKQNDPRGIELNYSSGTPGTVTLQFFSYVPAPLTISMTQSGLVSPNTGSGSAVAQVTLVGPGGTAAPSGQAPSSAPSSVAPASSQGGPGLATGQTTSFNVPASPNGFNKSWTFTYPGDNSNIIFDAEVGGLDPSFGSAVGFNVFDSQHQSSPLEVATTQTNQKQNDPHGIEFVYSSGTPGTVTVQFFSYAPAPVTITLTQGGLTSSNTGSGSTTTPVTLHAA